MSDYLDKIDPLTAEEVRFAEGNIDHAIHYAERARKAILRMSDELRARRAADLSDTEVRALRKLADDIRAEGARLADFGHEHVALAVLERLVGGGK
jgi:hypothetical protein